MKPEEIVVGGAYECGFRDVVTVHALITATSRLRFQRFVCIQTGNEEPFCIPLVVFAQWVETQVDIKE